MSTSEDNRLTWGLIIDVLDALEKHGYHRGDNQHVGSAVGLIAPLARAYEGNQEQPGSAHPSPPRPPHQAASQQPDCPADPDTSAVDPGDRRIILAALGEAADLKRDRAANCSDCADQSCGTCEFWLKAAQAYERVAARLLGAEKASTPRAPGRDPVRGGPLHHHTQHQAQPETEARR
jgi:hypothetical protein